MTEDQIKHMVNRFLSWRLPENFNPDGGISFKRMFNEHTAHPMKHEPSGTNLLDYTQAEAMVRHMIDGVTEEPSSTPLQAQLDAANEGAWHYERQLNAALKSLQEILDMHVPDQPAAFDIPEVDWVKRHVMTLRRHAKDAISVITTGGEAKP